MTARSQVEFSEVFVPVSHSSGVPLNLQVVHQVEDAIRRGTVSVGDFLPPEPQLSAGFGAGRNTIRRAITQLMARGIVDRRPGRGTQVVKQVSMDYSNATSPSLHADLRAAQRNPSTQVRSCSRVTADVDLSQRTLFPVGTDLVVLERLRRAGEMPLAIMGNHLLADIVTFDVTELEDASLDELLRSDGHFTRTIEYEVTPDLATAHQAEVLGIRPGTPVLCERRWAYTAAERYINYSENFYHPENFHFRGVLTEP